MNLRTLQKLFAYGMMVRALVPAPAHVVSMIHDFNTSPDPSDTSHTAEIVSDSERHFGHLTVYIARAQARGGLRAGAARDERLTRASNYVGGVISTVFLVLFIVSERHLPPPSPAQLEKSQPC